MINLNFTGPLNAKQYRQLSQHHSQSTKTKDKCLHFKFPIIYPCSMKSKRKQPSIISNSSRLSQKKSNNLNRLKSAISILFIDDKNDDMSKYKIPNENSSSSLLNIPLKSISTHKIHSSNAYIEKQLCQLCGSILSNGICLCIIQNLLKLNNTKRSDILVEFNDIFENLTSNNIIT
jgi:hypothetical protein